MTPLPWCHLSTRQTWQRSIEPVFWTIQWRTQFNNHHDKQAIVTMKRDIRWSNQYKCDTGLSSALLLWYQKYSSFYRTNVMPKVLLISKTLLIQKKIVTIPHRLIHDSSFFLGFIWIISAAMFMFNSTSNL